jgi:hypothetical protein
VRKRLKEKEMDRFQWRRFVQSVRKPLKTKKKRIRFVSRDWKSFEPLQKPFADGSTEPPKQQSQHTILSCDANRGIRYGSGVEESKFKSVKS